MSTETIILLIVLILLVGALPSWPYSRDWGYSPLGAIAVILIIFVCWAVLNNRPLFRSAGSDAKSSLEDAAHDLKRAGQDVGDSIRRTVR